MKKLLVLVVLMSLCISIFAENKNVAIVYNGSTAVNRETTKYIIKQSTKVGLEYQFKAFKVADFMSSSEYSSVIIINTGIRNNGIDPVLKSFIDKTTNKDNLILLTFNKGEDSFKAELVTGDNALHGVDGISSASIYKNGNNNDFKWFDMLVDLLKGPMK